MEADPLSADRQDAIVRPERRPTRDDRSIGQNRAGRADQGNDGIVESATAAVWRHRAIAGGQPRKTGLVASGRQRIQVGKTERKKIALESVRTPAELMRRSRYMPKIALICL